MCKLNTLLDMAKIYFFIFRAGMVLVYVLQRMGWAFSRKDAKEQRPQRNLFA
jgi:hypothetical protein